MIYMSATFCYSKLIFLVHSWLVEMLWRGYPTVSSQVARCRSIPGMGGFPARHV